MIRVLNILESITFGGVERRRLSLAKLLDKSEFELKIVCTHHRGGLAEEIENNGIEVIAVGRLTNVFDWKQHRQIQKIIDDFKPHIIHGAVFEGVTMAAINGCLKRVPIVIIEETSDPKNRSWRGNLLMKLFSCAADKVIGVSPSATDYLKDKLRIPKQKVQLINNGVAIPRTVSFEEKAVLKNELGLESGAIIIGSTGRMLMDSHKRFSDLIKAFCQILNSGCKAKLVLVGDGPEMQNYKFLVEQLGIQKSVFFVGYQSDVAKYYGIFDVFALVSAYEAFGLVLAEAMLHKLPVVATRVGGMQYIVDDKQTGFLVEKYNVDEIAEKLKILCLDAGLRTQQGNEGYKKAMNNFTEERYVSDVENLYFDLVKKKKIKLS